MHTFVWWQKNQLFFIYLKKQKIWQTYTNKLNFKFANKQAINNFFLHLTISWKMYNKVNVECICIHASQYKYMNLYNEKNKHTNTHTQKKVCQKCDICNQTFYAAAETRRASACATIERHSRCFRCIDTTCIALQHSARWPILVILQWSINFTSFFPVFVLYQQNIFDDVTIVPPAVLLNFISFLFFLCIFGILKFSTIK